MPMHLIDHLVSGVPAFYTGQPLVVQRRSPRWHVRCCGFGFNAALAWDLAFHDLLALVDSDTLLHHRCDTSCSIVLTKQ